MSGIFGIFNRNGNSVDRNIVENMLESMSSWDPDERDLWINGPVALGHTMLWNTPESKYEHLPLQKDVYVLTMDARIDNRDELAKELILPERPMSEIGDSEFILAAYQKWGEQCSKYLLGDFSFAIWDEEQQHLFCSRDYFGIKPFYYYLDDERFIFSNDIKVLLAYDNIDYIVNESAVASYLKYNFLVEQDTTFFENIHKLSVATNITIMASKEKRYTYWKAEDCPKIEYKSLDEYIKVARDLLEKAVDSRIRSVYPIASHLSGGLDSSSVSVLASRKLALNGHRLTGFNWIPVLDSKADRNYYEWGNSKKIALLENIEHCAINLSEDDVLDIYKTLDITFGDTLHFWYEAQIQKYASKKGIRVILSGTGGDQFLSNSGYIEGKRISWLQKFKKVHKVLVEENFGSRKLILGYIKKIYSFITNHFVPNWFFCVYNGTHCGFNRVLNYLQPSVLKLISQQVDDRFGQENSVRNGMLLSLNNAPIQTRLDSWNVSGRQHKVEYRYPLLDKRIVEFALGIPEEIFQYNGKERFLFRRIIENLLPQEIAFSDTKYEPKRVEKYVEITQKAQNKWRKLYVSKNNKYIKLNKLFKEIDKCAEKNAMHSSEDDIIISVTNAILVINASFNKGEIYEKME